NFFARIVIFTHQKIAFADWAVAGDSPGFVGRNDFARAIGIFNFQLRHERGRLAVSVAPDFFRPNVSQQAEADVAGIPTVAEPRTERVAAGLDERRHVVGVVVGALVIVRPARREPRVAEALAG